MCLKSGFSAETVTKVASKAISGAFSLRAPFPAGKAAH